MTNWKFARILAFVVLPGAPLGAQSELYRDVRVGSVHFGRVVANVGDLDGDRVDDFATIHRASWSSANELVVCSGASGSVLRAVSYPSGNLLDLAGDGGDVDNDGTPDIVASTGTAGTDVLSGVDGRIIFNIPELAHYPHDVACGGDANGDGHSDIVIGYVDSTGAGVVGVYSGATGGLLHGVHSSPHGASSDDFGWAVDFAGDVDGDGCDDYLIGDPGKPNHPEEVYLFSGINGTLIRTWFGPSPNIGFGREVSGAGDVDNDSVPDIMVGAPFNVVGSVWVYSGATGAELHEFRPASSGTGFGGKDTRANKGKSICTVGDVNQDGYADIAIGASEFDADYAGFSFAGRLRVYSGRDASLIAVVDGLHREELGHCVAAAGDIHGDGFLDLLVGAKGQPGFSDPMVIALSMIPDVSQTLEVSADSRPEGYGSNGQDGPILDLNGRTGTLRVTAFGWWCRSGGSGCSDPGGDPNTCCSRPLNDQLGLPGGEWVGGAQAGGRFAIGSSAQVSIPSGASGLRFFSTTLLEPIRTTAAEWSSRQYLKT